MLSFGIFSVMYFLLFWVCIITTYEICQGEDKEYEKGILIIGSILCILLDFTFYLDYKNRIISFWGENLQESNMHFAVNWFVVLFIFVVIVHVRRHINTNWKATFKLLQQKLQKVNK